MRFKTLINQPNEVVVHKLDYPCLLRCKRFKNDLILAIDHEKGISINKNGGLNVCIFYDKNQYIPVPKGTSVTIEVA